MESAIESAGKSDGGTDPIAPRATAVRATAQTRIDREIGGVLRRVRLGAGLSQQAVARLVGTSFQQIQKYERGVNRVPLSRLILFCEALDVTVLDVVAEVVEIASGSARRDVRASDEAAATRLGARAMAAVARVEDPQVLEAVIRLLDSVSGDTARAKAAAGAPRGRAACAPASEARLAGRNA